MQQMDGQLAAAVALRSLLVAGDDDGVGSDTDDDDDGVFPLPTAPPPSRARTQRTRRACR